MRHFGRDPKDTRKKREASESLLAPEVDFGGGGGYDNRLRYIWEGGGGLDWFREVMG